MKIGIDALAFDLPKLFLPIEELAIARAIEPEKLTKGLGLLKMSVPDVHQDAVVLAANALYKLISNNNITPSEISKIYVGTESGVDSSKPIATYLLPLMENKLGEKSLHHCDVVDMTFACVGGVDAMQSLVDFVRLNPDEKAIVICTDIAKYDLGSGGEYTQGAGAIAMLISANPRLLAFEGKTGVSTQGVFDFFKPRRSFAKKDIIQTEENSTWLGIQEAEVDIFKEQPVFDGQYSNQCYQDRVREAFIQFKTKNNITESVTDRWENIVMHLPYAFQGRRMFPEVYCLDRQIEIPAEESEKLNFLKAIAKSNEYQQFVAEKLQAAEIISSQIGNIYTGSIFLGLLSTLQDHLDNNSDLTNKKIGFIAYGSGSKSKVFEAEIQPAWKEMVAEFNTNAFLASTHAINMTQYEQWHRKELTKSILTPSNECVLDSIEKTEPNLLGARYYKWV